MVPVSFQYAPSFLSTFFFWHFLFVLGLSCIFFAPTLESTISLKITSSFYWRMDLEIKILVLDVLIAPGESLRLDPLSGQEISVCI